METELKSRECLGQLDPYCDRAEDSQHGNIAHEGVKQSEHIHDTEKRDLLPSQNDATAAHGTCADIMSKDGEPPDALCEGRTTSYVYSTDSCEDFNEKEDITTTNGKGLLETCTGYSLESSESSQSESVLVSGSNMKEEGGKQKKCVHEDVDQTRHHDSHENKNQRPSENDDAPSGHVTCPQIDPHLKSEDREQSDAPYVGGETSCLGATNPCEGFHHYEDMLSADSGGYPETCPVYSLEAYLSDFKSSESSGFDLVDMSESCIDKLIGKLDSPQRDWGHMKKETIEEDVVEDNRCPSTFYVSEEATSIEEALAVDTSNIEHLSARPPKATLSVIVEADSQLKCKGNGQPGCQIIQQDENGEWTTQSKSSGFASFCLNASLNQSSEDCRSKDQDSAKIDCTLLPSCGTDQQAKVEVTQHLPKQTSMDDPSSSCGSLSQILSEDHLQVLQLLGLSGSNVGSKSEHEDLPDFGLDMSPLSQDEDRASNQQMIEKNTDNNCDDKAEMKLPSFSDPHGQDSFWTSDMDPTSLGHGAASSHCGHDVHSKGNETPEHSDGESDMSVGSPCNSPVPGQEPQSPCVNVGDQLHTESGCDGTEPVLNLNNQETGNFENAAHEAENYVGGSFTDFSLLGLPPRLGKRHSPTLESSSAQVLFEGHSSGKGEEEDVRLLCKNPYHDSDDMRGNFNIGNIFCPVSSTSLSGMEAQGEPETSSYRSVAAPEMKGTEADPASFVQAKSDVSEVPMEQTMSQGQREMPGGNAVSAPPGQGWLGSSMEAQGSLHHARVDLFSIKPTVSTQDAHQGGSQGSVQSYSHADHQDAAVHARQMLTPKNTCHVSSSSGISQLESSVWQRNSLQQREDVTGVQLFSQQQYEQTASVLNQQMAKRKEDVSQWTSASQSISRARRNPENRHSEQGEYHRTEIQTHQSWQNQKTVQTPDLKQRTTETEEKDVKTVVVTAQALSSGDSELVNLYFENPKRSGGGEVEEGGMKWDERNGCFYITFVNTQAARNVASRPHTIKGSAVNVQLWQPAEQHSSGSDPSQSPPKTSADNRPAAHPAVVYHKDRFVVSGVPPGTSRDCLENYLEFAADVSVTSLSLLENNSTLVVIEPANEDLDVEMMKRASEETPLEEGIHLEFQRMPVHSAPSSVVHVRGLSPTTSDEAIRMYFSNKRRNGGGPVEYVERSSDGSAALVYFFQPQDAESVVRKGAHILEGCELNVSFHSSFSGKPGHAETSQYSPAVSLGRPHSDYGAAHEDSYERTGTTSQISSAGKTTASSPVAYHQDRVSVKGFPSETSADCLQNYIECTTDVTVASVTLRNNTALIMLDPSEGEFDVEAMERECNENPLEENVRLTFERVPVVSLPPPSVVRVTGLSASTNSEAIKYFFQNKKRNSGGPVRKVERTADSTALVYFENPEDAQSVVKKGDHKLDGHKLQVSLHDHTPDQPGQHEERRFPVVGNTGGPPSGYSSPPNKDIHRGPYGQDRSHRQPQSTPSLSPAAGTGFTKNEFSSSASAQLQLGSDRERRGQKYQTCDFGSPFHSQEEEFTYDSEQKSFPPAHRQSGESDMRRPGKHTYHGQSGRVDSSLISLEHSKTKEKHDFGGGNPDFKNRRGLYCQQADQANFGEENSDPRRTASKPEQANCNPRRQTEICIGAEVIKRIMQDHQMLRSLTTTMKSVDGKFHWKQPDKIVVDCLVDDPSWDWEEKVKKQVSGFAQQVALRDSQREQARSPVHQTDSEAWRSGNNSSPDLMEASSRSTELYPATPTPSSVDKQEDVIPNLKPAQLKVLMKPACLKKLCKGYPGLEISVDEERMEARVKAPEEVMKKAFSDVLAFVTGLMRTRLSLSPAFACMYEKESTQQWVQENLIEKYDLVCHWEVQDGHVELSSQKSDLMRLENIFKTAFTETSLTLEEDELCILKSKAWTSFVGSLQENRGGLPAPLLHHEDKKVIIIDTPSSGSKTRHEIRKFLDENRPEEKSLPIAINVSRFLEQFCADKLKELHSRAKSAGASITFNKSGMRAKGPADCLPRVVGEVKELVDRVMEDKMVLTKPGIVKHLATPAGKDFLIQTGKATGCFITTASNEGGRDRYSHSDGNVLAEIVLGTSHKILIVQGDITQCAVDAVVNAANRELSHGGGVALAIAKAGGGSSIQDESDELIEEKGRLDEGDVEVTGAGEMPCSHVLHAVGPIWKGGHRGEPELLQRTVLNTLKKAEEMELTSLAIPAISCGIFRFPVDMATSIIVQAIGSHFEQSRGQGSLKTLTLIDMGAEPLHGFIKAAKNFLGKAVKVKGEPQSSGHHGSRGDFNRAEERKERDSRHSPMGHSHGGRSEGPIKVIPGEIAKSRADVIVCTTHPSLDLRKGVLSKSIMEEGGEAIQRELHKFSEKFGKTQLGKVVRTTGGNLRCKSVYHLSLPSWRDDHGQTMKSAVKECLDEANKKGFRSIAFPTLGTGRLGYPSDKVASIMFPLIGQWLKDGHHRSIKEVQIIVYPKDTETLRAFNASERYGGGQTGGRRHGHEDRRSQSTSPDTGSQTNLPMKMGKLNVLVKEGNIMEENCDAIVNSSNDNLDLSKGVLSKKISEACGSDFLATCKAERDHMVEKGVAVTPVEASSLYCGIIIHVSADRFKHDWQRGILTILHTAEAEGLASVALPALGTGGRGADPHALAQSMQRAVQQFSRKAHSVKEVRIVVFQKQMLRPYLAAFSPDSPQPGGREETGAGSSERRGSHGREQKDEGQDIYIYSDQRAFIRNAKEKITRYLEHISSSRTETHPLFASFSSEQKEQLFKLEKKHGVQIMLDQRKSTVTVTGVEINVAKTISSIKDIILSVTAERHRAAGSPPVRWQYDTGQGKFVDFDQEIMITIEAAFKKKEREVVFADKRGRQYKIAFKDRKEYFLSEKRSPVSVRRRDMLEEKKQEIPLPTHWAPMKGDKCKLVDLKPESTEYKKVAEHFGQQAQIKKIQRVQNPSLFQQFKVKKKELEQYNPKGTENEKRLFHGTPSDSVDAIVANGFNRSYCGRHGTALGAGVYFAADSSVSMGYAKGGHMFQARVLVGEYTPGNSGMRFAPNKPSSNRPYDSVSNAPSNATVFVIFHDSQAYPEYLISF